MQSNYEDREGAVMDIDELIRTWERTPLDDGFASLMKGGDPTLPERWQGPRPSLTARRGWNALVMSWQEGQSHGDMSSVLALRNATNDSKRLAADLSRIHGPLDNIKDLEWRRVLDCCFICGIKGWSNLHRQALGDGSWKPLIKRGVRFKVGSDGKVLNAT